MFIGEFAPDEPSLGIFFIPLFYMVVTRLFSRRDRNKEAAALDLPATENPHE